MPDRLLLDTVTFVEYVRGTVPASIRQAIEQADRRCLSVITPWEIHLKRVLRDHIRPTDIATAIERMGIDVLPVLLEHLWYLWKMQEFPEHRDPFDRMLIAQACSEGLTLVTKDSRFSLYPDLSLVTY